MNTNENNSKPSIIVIEDIPQMYMLYQYCLESEFNVIPVKSFNELTQIENQESIQAAIMDYHIPGENFDNTLSYMKSNFQNAKRILISGHVNNLNLDATYKDDFSGIFSKPLKDYQTFKDYVIELLDLNKVIENVENNNGNIENKTQEETHTEEAKKNVTHNNIDEPLTDAEIEEILNSMEINNESIKKDLFNK